SKALPEICGSSLTTIAGLIALTTMSLRLGADLGLVLAKSILCSMLTVFLFMPCILLLFGKAIDKSTHRSLVSNVSVVGKADVKLRYVLAALFLAAVSVCTAFSFKTEYVYSQNSIDTSRPSQTMVAKQMTEEVFGYSNQFVILVPYGDYTLEKKVIDAVSSHDKITSALGISNVELTLNGCKQYLTDNINYKRFASLLGTDESRASAVYQAYAFFSSDDTSGGLEEVAIFNANKEIYTASLLQLCDCAFDHDDFIGALLYDDEDVYTSYTDLKEQVQDAERQLIGKNYTRCLFNIDGAVESEETFALIEQLNSEIKGFCPGAVFAGDSMSSYDLDRSFSTDNIKVSLLTVLFVFVILIFTLKSWGLPIPLTLTIQGAIFINFSYYAFASTNLFFFVYLIVSAIQMGATIDYAIVLTGRYVDLRGTEDKKQSVIKA
ncbi:MAG: MMPL family transporter, partial [Clostridia bacterium]|nr:MMPL family transporter [Clostridia bacterium]